MSRFLKSPKLLIFTAFVLMLAVSMGAVPAKADRLFMSNADLMQSQASALDRIHEQSAGYLTSALTSAISGALLASSNTAAFVGTDATTQGTWKGKYGADGYTVVNNATNYPAYAQVSASGNSPYTWVASTSDVRALQKATATDRIAATWFSSSSFTIDVNLTDGQIHQVALYCLDWGSTPTRGQSIAVLDAVSGTVLNSQSVSTFNGGKYLVWNVAGHVKFRVTRTAGANAVVSGLFFSTPGGGTPTPVPTPTPTPTPTPVPTPTPTPTPTPSPTPTAMGQMFIKSSELMAKPTSGAGWTFIKAKADGTWGTVRLSDQNLLTQSYVLAGALVYARTGNVTYKNKVIAAIKQVPGTEVGTTTQLLALARTLYGYVVSADMVGMDYNTVCNNGETWLHFLKRIRTTVIPGNSRWPTLEFTSGNTSSNWGAHALASHLAVSYALNDTAAIQRDINIFKRFLGDLSSPAAPFQPTSSYNYHSDGATWDMSPTLLRGINPDSATDKRAGALIEDALRLTSGGADSVACCTVQPAAVGYQEETLDGILSTAQLLRAHGVDLTTFQTSAMKRAFAFYITHGGPSSYSVSRYLPYAINYLYGTNYPTQTEDRPYRHMGYGSWLFTH
jgi:hypothetical protein